MFGHDDHDENNKPHDDNQGGDQPDEEVVKPTDTAADDGWQHPGPPPSHDDNGSQASDTASDDDNDKKGSHDNLAASFSFGHSDSNAHPDAADAPDNELIDLKQEALGKLSPLIGHLDQSPDEKFRTLMMMIQASDDQALVRQAYETALKIDDEKERAQALLDIVNEINYFTQTPGKN